MTTKDKTFDRRLTVGFTGQQDQWLADVARTRSRSGQAMRKADVVRAAVDFYCQHQPDLPGSRKAIAQSIEGKIAALEAKIDYAVTSLNELLDRIEDTGH